MTLQAGSIQARSDQDFFSVSLASHYCSRISGMNRQRIAIWSRTQKQVYDNLEASRCLFQGAGRYVLPQMTIYLSNCPNTSEALIQRKFQTVC